MSVYSVLLYLIFTNTSDEVKPNKIVKSGKITDPDCLFHNISKHIFERYTEVGIQLGLTGAVLTDELETGEFKMLQGSRKALKMLQLWQRSVTEDNCTYSVLAAALEKEGFTNCADKYCYSTGNHNINDFFVHVLISTCNYILDYN